MNHLRRIFAAAVTLAGAMLALAAAPAASAMQVPPPGQGSGIAPPPPPDICLPAVASTSRLACTAI